MLSLIAIIGAFAAVGFIFFYFLFAHAGQEWNRD
jgi:hypothetical protein